jgi:hypothetical protein
MRPSIMMFILLTRRQPVMKLLMSVGSASCFETRDLLGPVFPANNRAKNRGGGRVPNRRCATRAKSRARPPRPAHGFLFLRLLFTGPQPRPARGAHVAAGRPDCRFGLSETAWVALLGCDGQTPPRTRARGSARVVMNAVHECGDEKSPRRLARASDAVLINKGFVQDSVTRCQGFSCARARNNASACKQQEKNRDQGAHVP